MPKKYYISAVEAPPRFHKVGKFATVQSRENCAGSCAGCVKDACIYNIHGENRKHVSSMKEPEYLYDCKSCLRCIQECVKGTFSMTVNPEYLVMGDGYWTPEIITTTWEQAEKGVVPVSGAGYRGPFTGPGFDSMWTDMSEIVRPTRDGIHGREYINTSVQLSRRPERLEFRDGSLVTEAPSPLEVPLPVLFEMEDGMPAGNNVWQAMSRAAAELGTLLLVRPERGMHGLEKYAANIVPRLTGDNYRDHAGLIRESRLVELDYRPGIEAVFRELRELNPCLAIMVGMPLDAGAAEAAHHLAITDVDTLHFYADSHGKETNTPEPRDLKDMIREIHVRLIDGRRREKVNLVFSGGIALAEHMAKAVICGADAVAIGRPLLVALECRLCRTCDGAPCPVRLEELDPAWGSQRIVNLMAAWHNQLLEVMGAMGIREVRRLRGEIGRSMWFEDLERESFGPIFGERKIRRTGRR